MGCGQWALRKNAKNEKERSPYLETPVKISARGMMYHEPAFMIVAPSAPAKVPQRQPIRGGSD